MKTYFFTGLILLLPLVLTILISIFVLRLLTQPFMGIAESLFSYYSISFPNFFFISGEEILRTLCQVVIIVFLTLLTILIGFAAQSYIFHKFFHFTDYLFHKIPMVNKIYTACKSVVTTLLGPKKHPFGAVVLVSFPHKGIWSLGLVMHEALRQNHEEESHDDLISVFLPTTPNPTMGFLLLFQRKDLIFTDMRLESAFRSIMSCGLMVPSFDIVHYELK